MAPAAQLANVQEVTEAAAVLDAPRARGIPMTGSIVTNGVRVRASTVACQCGETHKASSAATPSATKSGRPHHSATPSASVSRARGCWGASGRRALSTVRCVSCTRMRVTSGPGLTPIHIHCGSSIEGLLADGIVDRDRQRRQDSQRRGWLGSLMRHYRAELSGTVTRLTGRVTDPAPPGLLIPAAGGAQGHLSGALCTNPAAIALPAITAPAEVEQFPTIWACTDDEA